MNLFKLQIGCRQDGFSMIELLVTTCTFLLLSSLLFGLLIEIQQLAVEWVEVQGAVENTRLVLDRVGHFLRQAGNDPRGRGFPVITIFSPVEVRLRSDLTGSTRSDRGDPDGDTEEPWEDIVIRYSPSADKVSIVHGRGPAQTIAQEITGFSIQFYDEQGAETNDGSRARTALVTATGCSTHPIRRTGRRFAITLSSFVHLNRVI